MRARFLRTRIVALRWWCVAMCLGAVAAIAATAVAAAAPEERLVDLPPFDLVVLDEANGNAALQVEPLELPGRRIPAVREGDLPIRLVTDPTHLLEVPWANVVEVRFFEDMLLAEAKREVLNMAAGGYHPPLPEKIYAAGRDALAALRVGIFMMKEGCYITEHEAVMANQLAKVMTGGEWSRPAWVDEQYILDLEREAFLSLCGEEKTQARMWNVLQTGKVIRN